MKASGSWAGRAALLAVLGLASGAVATTDAIVIEKDSAFWRDIALSPRSVQFLSRVTATAEDGLLDWQRVLAASIRPPEVHTLATIHDLRELGDVVTAVDDPNIIERREAHVGIDDSQHVEFLIRGRELQRAVGRITPTLTFVDPKTRRVHERLTGYGTGFLIAPNLLLTNEHVTHDRELCEIFAVYFNFRACDPAEDPQIFVLDPKSFYFESEEHDFAIVGVKPRADDPDQRPPGERLSFIELRRHPTYVYEVAAEGAGQAATGMPVNIIHHPGGGVKKITIRNNRVHKAYHADHRPWVFTYTTDTDGGSSGSPLFDDDWTLIGIHCAEGSRQNGRVLYNVGVRIDKVIEHIRSLPAIDGRSQDAFWSMVGPAARPVKGAPPTTDTASVCAERTPE